jgi:hypothetical protein
MGAFIDQPILALDKKIQINNETLTSHPQEVALFIPKISCYGNFQRGPMKRS